MECMSNETETRKKLLIEQIYHNMNGEAFLEHDSKILMILSEDELKYILKLFTDLKQALNEPIHEDLSQDKFMLILNEIKEFFKNH